MTTEPGAVQTRLEKAIRGGPTECAAAVSRLLAQSDQPLSTPLVSIEWISDWYSRELGDSQRACFRDAVVLLLEDTSNTLEIQGFVRLARAIGIFAVARSRTQERVLEAVYIRIAANDMISAAHLLFLLAEEGDPISIETWSSLYQGDPTAALIGPCLEGILRHGTDEALRWLAEQALEEGILRELLAEFLPRMVLEDRAGVDRFLRTHPAGKFRLEVYASAGRYELFVPDEEQATFANSSINFLRSIRAHDGEGDGLAALEALNKDDVSSSEAIEVIASVDKAGVPSFMVEYIDPSEHRLERERPIDGEKGE